MTLPTMVGGTSGPVMREWMRGCDEGPFAALAVGERIAFDNHEMWTTLAVAAGVTERIDLISTIVVVPLHDPVDLAKRVATLDVLSSGRLRLGVGVGGRDEDYRSVGSPVERKWDRLDTSIEVMRSVWAGDQQHESIPPVGPRPTGQIELLSASMGPKSMARSAVWADGLAGFLFAPDPASVNQSFDQWNQAWASAGRTGPTKLVTSFWYALGGDGKERLRHYGERYLGFMGDELATALAESANVSSEAAFFTALDDLEAAGAEEVILVPTDDDPAELERTLSALARR